MRLDDFDNSINVEDQRGGGGSRMGGPGGKIGCGSLVIALIGALVFGINPLQTLGTLQGMQEAAGPVAAPQAGPQGRSSLAESCSANAFSRESCNALASLNKTWEPLFRKAGIELVHVPARGEPQAITDLMSGSVDFYFGNTSVLLGSDLEKIRLLAVGSAKRLPGAPELPTVAETIPGFEFASWNGFFVPKGTPDATIEKIRGAIIELVNAPSMKDKLTKLGIVPGGQSKEEVAATFKKDAASFSEAVAAAGIKKPEAK